VFYRPFINGTKTQWPSPAFRQNYTRITDALTAQRSSEFKRFIKTTLNINFISPTGSTARQIDRERETKLFTDSKHRSQ